MYKNILPGIGRLGTMFAFGLALWAGTVTGQTPCQTTCGSDDPAPSIFWGGVEPAPRDSWYASTDALALQRIFSGLGPAATLGMGSTGSVALSQKSLDDPYQAGIQMLVGHTFSDSPYQAEVSYFWIDPLAESAQTASPTFNLFSPFTNFGQPLDTRVDENSLTQIHLVSRLEGGEANLKYKLCLPAGDPTIALLFGVRHVGLREEFDYSSTPLLNVNPVSVHAHTNNDLWGPQIGGSVDYGHQDIWIHAEGKAAICNNGYDRELQANIGGAQSTQPKASESCTAYAADISLSIFWRPTSALTARVGYQALWIDQVALAARNFAPSVEMLTDAMADPPINQRGTLIYQGPFAGLQLSW